MSARGRPQIPSIETGRLFSDNPSAEASIDTVRRKNAAVNLGGPSSEPAARPPLAEPSMHRSEAPAELGSEALIASASVIVTSTSIDATGLRRPRLFARQEEEAAPNGLTRRGRGRPV